MVGCCSTATETNRSASTFATGRASCGPTGRGSRPDYSPRASRQARRSGRHSFRYRLWCRARSASWRRTSASSAKADSRMSEVAFMGDDLLDLPVLNRVGLSAAPADAVADVRERVDWVSQAPGGRGAVRELVELVLRAQGRWTRSWRAMPLEATPDGRSGNPSRCARGPAHRPRHRQGLGALQAA